MTLQEMQALIQEELQKSQARREALQRELLQLDVAIQRLIGKAELVEAMMRDAAEAAAADEKPEE